MKLKRFQINESLYNEPWSENKLNNYSKLKNELSATEDDLRELLTQYLLLNPNIQEDKSVELDPDEARVKSFEYFDNHPHIRFDLYYQPEDGDNDDDFLATITNREFNDFLNFLKDTETYKMSKKYNIL